MCIDLHLYQNVILVYVQYNLCFKVNSLGGHLPLWFVAYNISTHYNYPVFSDDHLLLRSKILRNTNGFTKEILPYEEIVNSYFLKYNVKSQAPFMSSGIEIMER